MKIRVISLCVAALFAVAIVAFLANPPRTLDPMPTPTSIFYISQLPNGVEPRKTAIQALNVFYLVAEDSAKEAFHQRIVDELDFKVAHTWQDFSKNALDSRIDILVIHASARAEVDSEWLAQAQGQGMLIALVDLYSMDYVELIGSKCKDWAARGVNPYAKAQHFYFSTMNHVWAADPDNQEKLEQYMDDNCDLPEDIGVFTSSAGIHGDLDAEHSITEFGDGLSGLYYSLQSARYAALNLHLRPTAVPNPHADKRSKT